MNMTLVLTFVFLNIINVILQTFRSLATIKCGKVGASVVNALAYGLYTVVIIYTVCDLPLAFKAFVVGACNLVGVYIVKTVEQKLTKDKLWKVELTVTGSHTIALHKELQALNIPHTYIENVGKYTIFNIFCATQKESTLTKDIANRHKAKYFVTESKAL